MITHRARDDWETTPGDGEALARALRTIADDAPSPSADVPVRLDTVRSRVRRRRSAKMTALGATTLGVVAVLAVGATQLPAWDTHEPSPAEPATPFAAACGTTVDLDPLPEVGPDNPPFIPAYAVTLDGDTQVTAGSRWNGTLRVTGGSGRPGDTVRLVDVGVVAARGLEVVGVPGEAVVPSQESAEANGPSGPRIGVHFVSCESGGPLAPGAYDVYARATLLPGTGELPVLAGPVTIDVGDPRAMPDAVGDRSPWLEGTPVSSGMSADDPTSLAGTALTSTGDERSAVIAVSVGPVAWVRGRSITPR